MFASLAQNIKRGGRLSKQIELQINQLLKEFDSVSLAAEELIKKSEASQLSRSDVDSISSFLYSAGFLPSLNNFCKKNLESGKPISWHYWAELIARSENTNPLLFPAFVAAAEYFGDLAILAQTPVLDNFEPNLKSLRQAIHNQEQIAYERQKEVLIEQLELVRRQDNFEHEARLVQKLQTLYPRNAETKKQIRLYLERRGRKLLDDKSAEESPAPLRPLTTEEEAIVSQLLLSAQSQAISRPELVYNIAIAFVFMEAYPEALSILTLPTRENEEMAKDWLIAEILVLARSFLIAVDWVTELEKKYAHLPHTKIAAEYLRALCYWELGQREAALGLMTQIIEVDPTYRLCQMYLSEWSHEMGSTK